MATLDPAHAALLRSIREARGSVLRPEGCGGRFATPSMSRPPRGSPAVRKRRVVQQPRRAISTSGLPFPLRAGEARWFLEPPASPEGHCVEEKTGVSPPRTAGACAEGKKRRVLQQQPTNRCACCDLPEPSEPCRKCGFAEGMIACWEEPLLHTSESSLGACEPGARVNA